MGLGRRRHHARMGLADEGLGIFFTLVIGGGFMLLIFYSSRAGYDEAPQIEYDERLKTGEPPPTARSRTVVPISSGRNSKRRGDEQQHDKVTRIRA
jgi:hypothetical protein